MQSCGCYWDSWENVDNMLIDGNVWKCTDWFLVIFLCFIKRIEKIHKEYINAYTNTNLLKILY